jgi:hypothetical protein
VTRAAVPRPGRLALAEAQLRAVRNQLERLREQTISRDDAAFYLRTWIAAQEEAGKELAESLIAQAPVYLSPSLASASPALLLEQLMYDMTVHQGCCQVALIRAMHWSFRVLFEQ